MKGVVQLTRNGFSPPEFAVSPRPTCDRRRRNPARCIGVADRLRAGTKRFVPEYTVRQSFGSIAMYCPSS